MENYGEEQDNKTEGRHGETNQQDYGEAGTEAEIRECAAVEIIEEEEGNNEEAEKNVVETEPEQQEEENQLDRNVTRNDADQIQSEDDIREAERMEEETLDSSGIKSKDIYQLSEDLKLPYNKLLEKEKQLQNKY